MPEVGAVPAGMPTPTLPAVALSEVGPLFGAALGIALVSFADTSVLSRTFAARQGYRVDPNRELIGLGVANLAGGLFRGSPVSSSSSRTPMAESAGSKTQLTGVVGSLAILALLVFAPGILHDLPAAALAAVVIAAALRLFGFESVWAFYRVNRSDFVLTMIAFVVVAAFGVLIGVPIAVGMSLLDCVRRAWRPHDAILGRARGVKGYHDVTRYRGAVQTPGLVLFRWDAPLFFANADLFRTRVLDAVHATTPAVKWVIIAAQPITDVDTTAAEAIQELDTELATLGIELNFAEVKDRLHRYDIQAKIGHDSFFSTIGVAVKAYLARHQVEWTDWEESPRDESTDGPAKADAP